MTLVFYLPIRRKRADRPGSRGHPSDAVVSSIRKADWLSGKRAAADMGGKPAPSIAAQLNRTATQAPSVNVSRRGRLRRMPSRYGRPLADATLGSVERSLMIILDVEMILGRHDSDLRNGRVCF
ncbi:hypothetical protein [Burkholderia metallica]|uniref:hypothetical protein n=1 Tax=Burkholderia metallica TaxID=488729 RepID=UPI001CF3AC4F|nr:hypothetical protein [Burkholderia metallica]